MRDADLPTTPEALSRLPDADLRVLICTRVLGWEPFLRSHAGVVQDGYRLPDGGEIWADVRFCEAFDPPRRDMRDHLLPAISGEQCEPLRRRLRERLADAAMPAPFLEHAMTTREFCEHLWLAWMETA